MKRIVLLIVPVLLLSCGSESAETSSGDQPLSSVINPPLEGDFQNDTLFRIDPTQPVKVETPNGSSIEIPANILVDADGKPVKTTVELSFTQYHSTADILASGIPMVYDSAGTEHHFESAGMFSLHAESEDKPVFVKEGSKVTVNLASDKDEAFNFYQMNEQSGHWTYEHSPKPVITNPRFDPSTRPIKPERATNNAFVLDLNFDLSAYRELSIFSGIVWEYTGEHDSLDPRKNSTVAKTRWTDFELKPTFERAYEYFLTMKTKENTFTTRVKAALNGEDFDKAMADFQTKKVEAAQRMDAIQKPYIRSVSIDGFGTYNYDYIHQMGDPEPILADFDFGPRNSSKKQALVFVVYPTSDVVVNYPSGMWSSFALDKSQDAKVMAVLPGNELAICKTDLSKSYGKKSYTFSMDLLPEKITAKKDLERIIAEF